MNTERMISPGAELHMGVKYPLLDHGYIKLVDYLGCDNTVVAAARHSYDKGLDQEDTIGNEKLINFLMRSKHTSPFEQPAMVFEVKAPIMVFREWHRHRTGKLNEQSARYSQLAREFYVPAMERVQLQSTTNKQGSGAQVDDTLASNFRLNLINSCNMAFDVYEESIKAGIAKELCRLMLPVNTYSTMVFQSDMSNWMNFLRLRAAKSAQWEIRIYAEQICKVMEAAFPVMWAAFEEYVLNAITLSRTEIELLRTLIPPTMPIGRMNELTSIANLCKKIGAA